MASEDVIRIAHFRRYKVNGHPVYNNYSFIFTKPLQMAIQLLHWLGYLFSLHPIVFCFFVSFLIHSHFTVSLQNRFRLYHQSSSSQFNCWRIERRLCWRLCEWKHLQLSEFKSKELCTQITDRNNDKNRILFIRR